MCADDGGRRHGPGAAGRHQLVPRKTRILKRPGAGGLPRLSFNDRERPNDDLAAFAPGKGHQVLHDFIHRSFRWTAGQAVPAQAIADMQEDGAGFAGFATWLDMTPAHPDMLAVPDPETVIQLPGSQRSPGSPPIQ